MTPIEWFWDIFKFIVPFAWSSDKNEKTSVKIDGNSNNVLSANGRNINQTINNYPQPENEKKEARKLYNAAIENLRFNGRHVGCPQVPFECDGIKQLISYTGLYLLDAGDAEILRNYVSAAARCNGGRVGQGVTPGFVQGQQHSLIEMLEGYLSRIK
jgi:hypothetical protein